MVRAQAGGESGGVLPGSVPEGLAGRNVRLKGTQERK